MEFNLIVKMDNAAFYGCEGMEIARILHGLAEIIKKDFTNSIIGGGKLFDNNGNSVGSWDVR